MCILCICTYTNILSPLRVPGTLAMSIPSMQSMASKQHSCGLLGEMPNSRVGAGKYKINLEHLGMPESKRIREWWQHDERQKLSLKCSSGKVWGQFDHQNNDTNSLTKIGNYELISVQLVIQTYLILCDPMDCSMPHFPVHHQLPEPTQTHVDVGDAIQPSHPLLSPSLPAFNLYQHQGLFQWVSSSYQVAKVLEFQLPQQSFQWIFRTDFL